MQFNAKSEVAIKRSMGKKFTLSRNSHSWRAAISQEKIYSRNNWRDFFHIVERKTLRINVTGNF